MQITKTSTINTTASYGVRHLRFFLQVFVLLQLFSDKIFQMGSTPFLLQNNRISREKLHDRMCQGIEYRIFLTLA